MASLHLNPPEVISLGAIWPPVCALIVGLRFVSRRVKKNNIGWDDWLTLPALALVIGMSAATLRGVALQSVAYPTPNSEAALTASSFEQTVTRQVFMAVSWMSVLALGCIKMSCMLFYRRIFRNGNTASTVAWWIIVALIVIWTISLFFTELLICGPNVYYLWSTLENELKCNNTQIIQNSFASSDVFTDLLVLIYPIPHVLRLQMSWKRKLGVTITFILGALTIVASIIRLVIYVQATSTEFTPPDADLASTAGIYFMILEAAFGLCSCCIPSLYGMVASKGLQSIVHSLGSMLSLGGGSNSGERDGDTTTHHRGWLSKGRKRSMGSETAGSAHNAKASTDGTSDDVELNTLPPLPPVHDGQAQGTRTYRGDLEQA